MKAFEKLYANYSTQFKLDALGTYLIETAAIFKIPIPSTVRSWKRKFETQGFDALQSKKKGRPTEIKKYQKLARIEESPEVLQARIKQLEIENKYLKKLSTLVQIKEDKVKVIYELRFKYSVTALVAFAGIRVAILSFSEEDISF